MEVLQAVLTSRHLAPLTISTLPLHAHMHSQRLQTKLHHPGAACNRYTAHTWQYPQSPHCPCMHAHVHARVHTHRGCRSGFSILVPLKIPTLILLFPRHTHLGL
jgi:hypothetical protein